MGQNKMRIIVLKLILSLSSIAEFGKHKKLARYVYPVWLYVAITGVIVYFLISPYYV